MAHLRKRKNGWQICIEKGKNPVTGKRERIYKTVHGTKKEAEKEMAKMITELEHGSHIKPDEMRFSELLKQWLDYCKPRLAPRTFQSYKMIVESHISELLGSIKVQDLQPIHIQTYQNEKLNDKRGDGKEGGLSPTTIRHHIMLIKQVLNYAVGLNLIPKNPAAIIKPPRRADTDIKYLDEEGVAKVLEVAKEDWRIYSFAYLAVNTGARRGELLGLEFDSVDLENKKISIVQTAQRVRGEGIIFKKPKTKTSKRSISISDGVVDVLKEIKKRQAELKLKFGEEYYTKRNLVFCKQRKSKRSIPGEPHNPGSVTRWWNKVAKKAGYPDTRLHDLRHTHATLLLTAGIHPKVVQERLGHSSITVTLDTYSHVIPTLQTEAAQKMDSIIEG